MEENKVEFRSTNKSVKKVVARAKACVLDVYSELETPNGKKIYK